jgi:hypothetical protein
VHFDGCERPGKGVSQLTSVIKDVQANERVYESLRAELERTRRGEWVVITGGELVAIAPTRKEALSRAGETPPATASRLVRQVGDELPASIRKL